jgi:uncharacterized membrane protein YhaH (DUF805 family)
MSSEQRGRESRFQLWGWILFTVCAGFFIASSVESRSVLSLVGSVIFLVACIVFMVPLVTKRNRSGRS